MSKISENASAKELTELMQGAKTLGVLLKVIPFAGRMLPGAANALKDLPELEKMAEILHLPDRFNDAFSEHGWIAYESMSAKAMESALAAEKDGGLAAAESALAGHYDESTLTFGIMRLSGHAEFRKRIRLIELAKEDYLAERYHACVPLLLALMDGLVNDVSKHVGFFAAGVDMTAWDSIAAHETGLKALAKIMGQGRNKTNEGEISVPYRNGILHGRELAFDNKVVAAKCWAAIFAIRDWAGSLADGKAEPKPKEKKSWTQLFKQVAENANARAAIDAWTPRTLAELQHLPCNGPPSTLPEGTPERVIAEFLDNWCKRRFGPMSDLLLDYLNTPKGKKAGRTKDDFGRHMPSAYSIVSVTDEAGAISEVEVSITLKRDETTETVTLRIRLFYCDEACQAALRGHEAGDWKIIQNGFSSVIYGV